MAFLLSAADRSVVAHDGRRRVGAAADAADRAAEDLAHPGAAPG